MHQTSRKNAVLNVDTSIDCASWLAFFWIGCGVAIHIHFLTPLAPMTTLLPISKAYLSSSDPRYTHLNVPIPSATPTPAPTQGRLIFGSFHTALTGLGNPKVTLCEPGSEIEVALAMGREVELSV